MLTQEQIDFLNAVVRLSWNYGTWKETPDGIDVDGDVDIYNHLKTEKIPVNFNFIDGCFNCSDNPNLTSLEGCPKKVNGFFDCSRNPNLTSLQGCPQEVGRDFNCSRNKRLTSLEGCPKKVGGDFYCTSNPIQTYKHLKDVSFDTLYISPTPSFDDLISDTDQSDILQYVSRNKIRHMNSGKTRGLFKLAALVKHRY